MTINDFIKECKKLFGDDIQYKVTTKDGIVFKQTKGWRDDVKMEFDQGKFREFNSQIKRTRF
jgi:hypothetical protein